MNELNEKSELYVEKDELIRRYIKDQRRFKVGSFYSDRVIPENYKKRISLTKTYKVSESFVKEAFLKIEKDSCAIAGKNPNSLIIIDYIGLYNHFFKNEVAIRVNISVYEDTRIDDSLLIKARKIYEKKLFKLKTRPNSFSERILGRSTDDEGIAFDLTMKFVNRELTKE